MRNLALSRNAAAILLLSLVVSPAAFAAADNATSEKPAQAQPDNKSYLPPWMQDQGKGANANTASSDKTGPAPDKSAEAADDDAKKRLRSTGQGQRPHRQPQGNGLFSGLAGLFGR